MKIKKCIFVFRIIIIILILSIFPICLIGFLNAEPLQYRMFTNIDDFDNLDQYVTKVMSTNDDKHINDLVFETSYIKKISYMGDTYAVYAYVFYEAEDAISYFKNATGKTTNSEWNYSMTTNYLFGSDYIVQYNRCVYRVEGGYYPNFAKAINFINESFSINVKELEMND